MHGSAISSFNMGVIIARRLSRYRIAPVSSGLSFKVSAGASQRRSGASSVSTGEPSTKPMSAPRARTGGPGSSARSDRGHRIAPAGRPLFAIDSRTAHLRPPERSKKTDGVVESRIAGRTARRMATPVNLLTQPMSGSRHGRSSSWSSAAGAFRDAWMFARDAQYKFSHGGARGVGACRQSPAIGIKACFGRTAHHVVTRLPKRRCVGVRSPVLLSLAVPQSSWFISPAGR